MPAPTSPAERVVAQNRRASHDYFILETVEAGLVLKGVEVKSLRQGKASLAEAYATVENGEVFVLQMHIPPYEQGNRWNLDPVRARKLLLHCEEIAKLLIGVARGRKTHDKRHAIAERDARREMDRARRRGERE